MLMRLGVRSIEEAENGQGAMAKVKAQTFSIVISDWHMEPINGLELLREVRRLSRPGVNRFIFSTTDGKWSTQTSAKIEGADAFITKPFTIEMLKATMTLVLSR